MTKIFSKNIWNEERARFEPGVISFSKSKIESIEFGAPQGVHAKAKIVDRSHLFIAPPAVDLHVHSRDFNESHKETFESCDAAALKGGVGTLACMANTRPRIDDEKRVREFLKRTQKTRARFIPFASVTKNLEGKEKTDWDSLLKLPIAGLSDDGKPILDEKIFRGALAATKKFKKILSLHEEDTACSKGSLLHESSSALRVGIEGSPENAESSLVERDLKIAAELKAPIHLGHISSAKSVALIRKAKAAGVLVSAELTPHHAFFTVDDVEKLSLAKLSRFKVCPPIRSHEDRSALLKAVENGTLDCFASDHAPHSIFEKDLPMDSALHGMISLEYAFTLYNELRLRHRWSWSVFMRAWFSRPAHLLNANLKPPAFRRGALASFILFDPLQKQSLRFQLSKSSNTLFEGSEMRGVICEHWILGEKVYDQR